MSPSNAVTLTSNPAISSGALRLGGVPVIHMLDRIYAGDPVEDVAEDFGVDAERLQLLADLAEEIRDTGASFEAGRNPQPEEKK